MTVCQIIQQQISSGELDEALRTAAAALAADPGDGELNFLCGKIHSRLGNRSAATGCYTRAVSADPENDVYRTALEMARDIEDFFNPDLLNP